MTIKPHITGWSTRRDYKPLANPKQLTEDELGDRLGLLDRAINVEGLHLDFAARCRRIVADAKRRGLLHHAEPQEGREQLAAKPVAQRQAGAGEGVETL